ncbi:SRPBCC family protein [Chitinophaga niabensis]|uniref:Polyketide cyclase / dehydrase and lipid transport n=1 Tax=Chitinophaga niabensis TaxID=536979 RepID=A0A1N6K0P6_9BACT|nr:hypothetical protein [Chitinophaga niabensis]SIO50138.1 hypothetical protein SAMN04488055_4845 [Chitinophaga niabensis]
MEQLPEENIPPVNHQPRKWLAIGVTTVISWLLTAVMFYKFTDYGIALFIFLPLFIGFGTTVLYGYGSKKPTSFGSFLKLGLLALLIYATGLLALGMEGLICILMSAPIGIALSLTGSLFGYWMITKLPGKAPTIMVILIGSIPLISFIERNSPPELNAVVTSIEINADPQTVWKNVVEFPQLNEPTELLFKTGIAYPINAKIEGSGVGAIRHCNFTTGSFVEPITVWDAPRLLKFDVLEQPAPMKELTFWNVDAPHLHDYFVSKCGQFKLTALPNGHTLLEGTTWYYHNIRPAIYWRLWSNYIIHEIHGRVLRHIKMNAESL